MSLAELSQIWKPYTHRQWLCRRKQKSRFIQGLRDNPTPAEIKAWDLIRYAVNFKHFGYYFCRQQDVYGYAVDFYCYHLKLGIEIDGSVHRGRERIDEYRQSNLQKHGVKLIRFTNDEVFNSQNYVQGIIQKACEERIATFLVLATPCYDGTASIWWRGQLWRIQTRPPQPEPTQTKPNQTTPIRTIDEFESERKKIVGHNGIGMKGGSIESCLL
ncbi:endonuclease domain-containing protein [Candidatus Bathyarchaeota archaeon]|nr:endonuclease domain-containing protein [Candidatus Bathyarchaeota archaeon]